MTPRTVNPEADQRKKVRLAAQQTRRDRIAQDAVRGTSKNTRGRSGRAINALDQRRRGNQLAKASRRANRGGR